MTAKKDNKSIAQSILKSLRLKIKPKNHAQKEFIQSIDENDITFAIGPAGTGKSHISIARALELIRDGATPYQHLIFIKPIVEAGESIGFLPGTIEEKIEPYLFSLKQLMFKLVGPETTEQLWKRKVVTSYALAYIRGMNIDNSIVILDEGQNTSKMQLKTFLTRIGFNTKYIIAGDLEQSDKFVDYKKSGLYHAQQTLNDIQGVNFIEFSESDVIRNPLISKILKNWNKI